MDGKPIASTPLEEIPGLSETQGPAGGKPLTQKAADVLAEKRRESKQRFSERFNQVMNATASSLESTSGRLSAAATYCREGDGQQVLTDLGGVIRRNPTQSLVASVVLGILLGRVFR